MASFLLAVLVLASCGSDTPAADDAPAASDTSATAPVSGSTTVVESSTTTTSATSTTVAVEVAQACDQEPLDETSGSEPNPPPDDVVVLLDRTGSQLCLGPALIDNTIIESATVEISQSGQWTVLPVFTVDGIEQFNAVAATCSTTSPNLAGCPSSRLAIVDGYTVVSAPTIHAATFERDQVIISGDFTELEARDLAASLVADGIVLRPVFVDLGPATDS